MDSSSSNAPAKQTSFWQSFGPGILFAGAAIGTSHLVQSTRAGAMFGLGLLGIVLFANFIKYPAFRFGTQFAAATGKSLIHGYRELGLWVVLVYLCLEVAMMAIVVAATALVSAAILLAVTGLEFQPGPLGIALILVGVALLMAGGYSLLDRLTKFFVAILTLATIAATLMSLRHIVWDFSQIILPISDIQTLGFIIALMGFMPSGLGLSVLQSLWSVAKSKTTGTRPSMNHAITDFNVGYLGSVALAVCFLLMGAGVMHSAGEIPATGAAAFAGQVIALFTSNLGNWAGAVVAASALFVMFTTLLTVLDGFPRMIATGIVVCRKHATTPDRIIWLQRGCTSMLVVLASAVLLYLMQSFQKFIDFVTITAFMMSPISALLNHLVMFSKQVPASMQPSTLLRLWSIAGILVLSGLSVMFIYVRFG